MRTTRSGIAPAGRVGVSSVAEAGACCATSDAVKQGSAEREGRRKGRDLPSARWVTRKTFCQCSTTWATAVQSLGQLKCDLEIK